MSSQLFCHLAPNEKCVEGKIQHFLWLNYGLDTQRAELMGASFLMGGWGSLVKTRWSTQVHNAQQLFLSLKRGKKEVPLWQMHCFVYMQYAICNMQYASCGVHKSLPAAMPDVDIIVKSNILIQNSNMRHIIHALQGRVHL